MRPAPVRRAPSRPWLVLTALTLIALGTRAAGADPPAFSTQAPDVGGVSGYLGLFTSIRLDGGGNPWVSYYDEANGNLKCAHKSAGVWTVEAADNSANDVGLFTSITIDGSGNPHISYYDQTNGNLMYAHKSAGVWLKETVDITGDVGKSTSIALSGAGEPRISYYDMTNGTVKFASKTGVAWTLSTATAAGSPGADGIYGTSLKLDSQGNPSISCYDEASGALLYAHRNAGIWSVEVADPAGDDVGRFSSLALDYLDRPQISYFDATNQHLKYALKSGGSWSTQTVDATVNVGWDTGIALDAGSNPRISYYDANFGFLKYARRINGVWETYFADLPVADVGSYSSIAMDASGRPHISYFDATAGNLKYAVGNADVTGVGDAPAAAAAGLTVYPNPSPGGRARIEMREARPAGAQAVEIFDLGGRRVRRLSLDATGGVLWDGLDEGGKHVESGIHFVRPVEADGSLGRARRLVVVR